MAMPVAFGLPTVQLTVGRLKVAAGVLAVGIAVAAAGGSLARISQHTASSVAARGTLASAPAALQSAVAATLARQYFVTHRGGTLATRGGGVSTNFASAGPRVSVGGTKLALTFSGIGYGAQLAQPTHAAPVANANQVTYRHAGVTEWYRNSARGLEQGFTLQQRPSGNATSGSLTIALRTSGAALSQHGATIRIAGTSASYGGLTAFDAAGHKLPSTLVLQQGTLLLRVKDAGARYPLTIDPVIGYGRMDANDGHADSAAGASVSLSADGATAVVGAPGDSANVGTAWIFIANGQGAWDNGQKLVPTGETGAGKFGTSVSISANGTTALVGGPADNSNIGAAWVFVLTSGAWSQQGPKLTGTGQGDTNGGANFGTAVALSAIGDTALVGAPRDYNGVTNPGAVFAFVRSSGAWTQQGAKIAGTGGTAAFLFFGGAVAVSDDGNTALVGGRADGNGPGSAWVFTRSGSTWTQQGSKLTANDESGSGHFGTSVALSDDGSTALIGGPNDNSNVGAAWVFTRSGSTWTQQGSKLTGRDESDASLFGTSVALSGSGDVALVGGPHDEGDTGAAWLYVRSSGAWAEQGTKLSGSGFGVGTDTTQSMGMSAALSDDGLTTALGSPTDQNGAGSAYGFHVTAPATPTTVTASAFDSGAEVQISSNDSVFTSYTVTASPGGATVTGGAMSNGDTWLDVNGLTNGVEYTFTVTATNQLGTSAASAPSYVVTPVATPVNDPVPQSNPAPTTTTSTPPADATPPTAAASPASSGTVTSDNGTTVAWPAGTFSVPVTISVTPVTGLGKTTLAAGVAAVELTIRNAAGIPVTSFSAPIELTFASVPANAVPAYSHDGGLTWTAIPQITGTTLPAGYPDGYFRDAAGNVHMLTMHATAFGTLAAGTIVTAALQVRVGVTHKLNVNYKRTLAVYVQTSLPGTTKVTLTAKGKTLATATRTIGVGSQLVSLFLPKSARHSGKATLTVRTTAGSEHASTVVAIARIAHWRT